MPVDVRITFPKGSVLLSEYEDDEWSILYEAICAVCSRYGEENGTETGLPDAGMVSRSRCGRPLAASLVSAPLLAMVEHGPFQSLPVMLLAGKYGY